MKNPDCGGRRRGVRSSSCRHPASGGTIKDTIGVGALCHHDCVTRISPWAYTPTPIAGRMRSRHYVRRKRKEKEKDKERTTASRHPRTAPIPMQSKRRARTYVHTYTRAVRAKIAKKAREGQTRKRYTPFFRRSLAGSANRGTFCGAPPGRRAPCPPSARARRGGGHARLCLEE